MIDGNRTRPRFCANAADGFASSGQIGVGDKDVEYNVTQSMPPSGWLHIPILDQVFKTGKKVADDFKITMRIVFDAYLPQWKCVATLLDLENPEV